jgi:hypothetical protein
VRFRERGVGRDGHGAAFLAVGEDLEQQLRAGLVQFQVAELVQAEQVAAAVAGQDLGQLPFVGGFGELVDQVRGGGVADFQPGFGDGGADADEQVGLAGAGVTDQDQRLPGLHPGRVAQLGDLLGGDVRVGGVVEVLDPLGPGEARVADQPQLAALVAVRDLPAEDAGEEFLTGGPLAQRVGDRFLIAVADGGQVQDAGGFLDRGVRGAGVRRGRPRGGGGRGHDAPFRFRRDSSWS